MENKFNILRNSSVQYEPREESKDGKEFLVVPVVMMKEGVHSGSGGPILYQEEELSGTIDAWNGQPVTLSHPVDAEGNPVSAHSPEVLEEYQVGEVTATTYQEGLRAEAWLEIEKLSSIAPDALAAIQGGQAMDVSIGVFADTESTEGEWNGEPYGGIAHSPRPDHLALLPEETGACSWNDGCGIRVNQKGGKGMADENKKKPFEALQNKGYSVRLIANEEGFYEIMDLLRSKVNAMDSDDAWYYLEEVYSDYLIYHRSPRNGGTDALFKQEYSVDDNSNVEFVGAPVEVRRNVEYITMKMKRTKSPQNNNQSRKENDMATTCCEGKVDTLIANKATRFTAEDREWLLNQEEATIDKLAPVAPEDNSEEVISTYKKTLKTLEDFTSIMPEALRNEVTKGLETYNAKRTETIQAILDNSAEGAFEKEQLETLSDEVLEGISKSVTPQDYSGQGAGITANSGSGGDDAPVMPVAGVEFETK